MGSVGVCSQPLGPGNMARPSARRNRLFLAGHVREQLAHVKRLDYGLLLGPEAEGRPDLFHGSAGVLLRSRHGRTAPMLCWPEGEVPAACEPFVTLGRPLRE